MKKVLIIIIVFISIALIGTGVYLSTTPTPKEENKPATNNEQTNEFKPGEVFKILMPRESVTSEQTMSIEVRTKVSTLPIYRGLPDGNYQIYVDEMEEDGVGNLYKRYEELKKKLELEGLFDEKAKKQIPKFPKRVGVITAKTGAAVRDIVMTIKKRCPIVEIIVFSSLVQGDGAKEDIVRNIKLAENYNIDTLIVGRGGGSIEDLWPFNEEIVARAIYNCPIPIISAVGHETDFTIADFVADVRAATPTAGAVIATPDLFDLIKHNNQLRIRLNEVMIKNLSYKNAAKTLSCICNKLLYLFSFINFLEYSFCACTNCS